MKQKTNPFPYSYDNKRYHTWNYYLKEHFENKIFKVALNADFSCPNRDGTCGIGGCTFCSALGSGDYAGDRQDDLETQFIKGIEIMRRKWPQGEAIAYFQAYTNTYAPLDKLKQTFDPFIQRADVKALAIATRADCLEDEKIAYLQSLTQFKEVWVEIGLQTIHNETAKAINRGHTFEDFKATIKRLKATDLKICVHLMNSLPNETPEMMIESARVIGQLPIHAVKIHMLHLLKKTQMGEAYLKKPWPLLSREEYINTVVSQLMVLPPEIVIQRLTGDGVLEDLIEPMWTVRKVTILNDIDKEMVRRNCWQGSALE